MLQTHEEKVLNILINTVSERQHILANNLTNVNTPGFIRKDLDFSAVLQDANKETSNKSQDRMIDDAIYEDDLAKPSYEKELSEMAENHLKYVLLTRINGELYKHMEEATQSGRAA